MKFWDASAIIPLCIEEPQSPFVQDIAKTDGAIVVWWGSLVECYSTFGRLRREGFLDPEQDAELLSVLDELSAAWTEIEPSDDVRDITRRLLQTHSLRAADSLQLAAAIVWAGKTPKGYPFVCLDTRLREAAIKEGFTVLPGKV